MRSKHSYSIEELAEKAVLPVRTVRYYISRGIIEGPEGRGKNAYYTREHLLKLMAAKELKEQGASLDDICGTVASLAANELELLVARAAAQKEREKTARDMSPKEYISALLDRSMVAEPVVPDRIRPMRSMPSPPRIGSTEWRRFTLKKGLELHVAGDMEDRYRPLIEEIIDLTGGKS